MKYRLDKDIHALHTLMSVSNIIEVKPDTDNTITVSNTRYLLF